MTRTKRYYNKNNRLPYFHPYIHICMGNCRFCKDTKKNQQERTVKQKEFRFEIKYYYYSED